VSLIVNALGGSATSPSSKLLGSKPPLLKSLGSKPIGGESKSQDNLSLD